MKIEQLHDGYLVVAEPLTFLESVTLINVFFYYEVVALSPLHKKICSFALDNLYSVATPDA